MNEPRVQIRIDGHRDEFRPGEILSGEYLLDANGATEIEALEVSVLWHTEGKGDEDLSVHLFTRVDADRDPSIAQSHAGRFTTQLPAAPLSYEGVIVKIHWCVRIRVFYGRGREVVATRPFRMGLVAPARSVLS